MKTLFLSIIIFFLFSFTSYTQSYLPEGKDYFTQDQIDNFHVFYPDCTEIEGDVSISGFEITNLNGLDVLTAFGGDLSIDWAWELTNLTGLDNVDSIGGSLSIGTCHCRLV